MNKIVLYILALLLSSGVNGQFCSGSGATINFESTYNTSCYLLLPIDSNSIWQIAAPQKALFNAAYSLPNVIVTDTLNPYSVNDTSSFVIMHIAGDGFTYPHTANISFYYQINSDSLTDYGIIEFSPDNGNSWLNLLDTTLMSGQYWYYWTGPKIITGNSNGWQSFNIEISALGPILNIQEGDTVLYRFTFISDSIQTNKDGWMIDDFVFEDYTESVVSLPKNTFQSKAFPNPASEQLFIEFENLENEYFELFLYNAYGQLILSKQIEGVNFIDISLHLLPQGIYHYELKNKKKHSVGKFSVLRD